MRRKLILLSGLLMLSTAVSAETPFEAGVQAYGKGDYAVARQNWEQALSAGDWEAARNLGLLYRKGLGVEADASKAATYYQQAADHGVVNAEMNLAELYLSGQGVPKDMDKAKQLLKDAADHGSLPARFRLDEVQDAEDRANGGLALTAPSQGGVSAPATAPVSPMRQVKPIAEPAPAVAPVVKAKPPVVAQAPIMPTPATPQAVALPEPVASPTPLAAPESPSPQKLADMAQEAAPPPPMPEKPPEKPVEKPLEKAAEIEPEKPAAEAPAAAVDVPPEPVKDVDAAGQTEEAAPLEVGQLRLHVASYRNESDAARGWLSYNLPGLMPELAAVTLPGKGKFIRLFAVGPAEQVHQLCDEMKTRGEICVITDSKK